MKSLSQCFVLFIVHPPTAMSSVDASHMLLHLEEHTHESDNDMKTAVNIYTTVFSETTQKNNYTVYREGI
jgi:hypothetical protein